MKIKTTYETLQKALTLANEHFDGNLVLDVEDRGKYYKVRLKVKDSKGKGARRGFTGRRMRNACWHAHGKFIDYIFELDPQAVVYTLNRKFTKENWEWIDWNAGSLLNPVYASELCYCD